MKDLFEQSTLVFGCGNILYGDDGFGPEVIHHLNRHFTLPNDVLALDMGTSVRDTLFDLALSPKKPARLVIVDAVEVADRSPGEIFEIPVKLIPEKKKSDFSLHQFPTVNLLAGLETQAKIEIKVVVVQVETVPDEVKPGLSRTVQRAVMPVCERILQLLGTGGLGPASGATDGV